MSDTAVVRDITPRFKWADLSNALNLCMSHDFHTPLSELVGGIVDRGYVGRELVEHGGVSRAELIAALTPRCQTIMETKQRLGYVHSSRQLGYKAISPDVDEVE